MFNVQGETKTAKTCAQRQKEYRMRKKLEKERLCPKKTPKTNAEHQRDFRQRQKLLQQSNSEEVNAARKKNISDRNKRYRDRMKFKKQHPELDFLPSGHRWRQSSDQSDVKREADSNNPSTSSTSTELTQPSTSEQFTTNEVFIKQEVPSELSETDESSSINTVSLPNTFGGAYANSELDAYDRFALSLAKKIKTIKNIDERLRLMNALQSMVDNFFTNGGITSTLPQPTLTLDGRNQEAVCLPTTGGLLMVPPGALNQQPILVVPPLQQIMQPAAAGMVNQPVQIQPIPTQQSVPPLHHIEPKTSSNQTQEKKKRKTPAKRKKNAEDVSAPDTFKEIPVEVAHPTEFISFNKLDSGASNIFGEATPLIDTLEIKLEKIEDATEPSSSSMSLPTATAAAGATSAGLQPTQESGPASKATFVYDPLPIKLEVVNDMDTS